MCLTSRLLQVTVALTAFASLDGCTRNNTAGGSGDADSRAGEAVGNGDGFATCLPIGTECIDELPEKCRESIILRCFCDVPFAKIAELTNRPSPDAARMFHSDTAINALAKQLRARGVTAVDLLS